MNSISIGHAHILILSITKVFIPVPSQRPRIYQNGVRREGLFVIFRGVLKCMSHLLKKFGKKMNFRVERRFRIALQKKFYHRPVRDEWGVEIEQHIFGVPKNKIVVWVIELWFRSVIVRTEGYYSPFLFTGGNRQRKILHQIRQKDQRSYMVYPLIGPRFERIFFFHFD